MDAFVLACGVQKINRDALGKKRKFLAKAGEAGTFLSSLSRSLRLHFFFSFLKKRALTMLQPPLQACLQAQVQDL